MEKEKKKILVIDDDKRILESFKSILESEGYTVDTAGTGREAIEKSETKTFHLVLLDIKIPDVEGTEVLAVIHKKFPQMVKIMVTGYPSLENAVVSLKHGASAYIMKPVNPERLLQVVKEKLMEKEEE